VVLSHLWAIVPADVLADTGPFYGLFLSGNFGVTVFFVMGAFLVTTSVTRPSEGTFAGRLRSFWSRRLARLMPHLLLVAVVLFLVSIVDRWDEWSGAQTRRSLGAAVTFTLNWSLVDDALANRPDVGHLWYLSVEQQAYLIVIPAILLVGRQRLGLAAVAGLGAVAVMIVRFRILDTDGWWPASLRTITRADALLLGVAAALIAPVVRRRATRAGWLVPASLAIMTFVVLLTRELDQFAYLEWPGVVFCVVATLAILGISLPHRSGRAERLLSSAPMRGLGQISYPLYIWHLPVFYASARWMRDWAWQPRALVAGLAVVIVVVLAVAVIEGPMANLIDRRRSARPAVYRR
jgi:peptidoglycan/LPS O-acetylase OafA/YrhL